MPCLLFLAASIAALLLGLTWVLDDSPPATADFAFRMAVVALLVFFLPGLVWGDALGFTSAHFLETLGLSFAISLCAGVLALAGVVAAGATIAAWVVVLYLFALAGAVVALREFLRHPPSWPGPFLRPLFDPLAGNVGALLALGLLVLSSVIAFRWGEDFSWGEKIQHFGYVRRYHALPLNLRDLAMYKGHPPPNLIHLWEFFLAAWARASHVDPLPLFAHARALIPVLGFSSLLILVRGIFWERRKTEAVFWGAVILSAAGFVLQEPSSLSWIMGGDPTRMVMSYLGTVHHADSAQDVMLPLFTGVLLYAWRTGRAGYALLCFGVGMGTFLWHPREMFQVGIYFAVATVTLLICSRGRLQIRKWAVAAGSLLACGALSFTLMTTLVPPAPAGVGFDAGYGYDEMQHKVTALSYAVTPEHLFGVRNLFNFPLHFMLSSTVAHQSISSSEEMARTASSQWYYDLWLFASAVAMLALLWTGDRRDRQLAAFLALLWFTVLCWNATMLLAIVIAYSEILMTTPRFIYLFAPLVVSAFFYRLALTATAASSTRGTIVRVAALFAASGIAGAVLHSPPAWPEPSGDATWVHTLGVFLTWAIPVSLAATATIPAAVRRALLRERSGRKAGNATIVLLSTVAVALFSASMLAERWPVYTSADIVRERRAVPLYSRDFSGYSPSLIEFLTRLEPGASFAIDPVGHRQPTWRVDGFTSTSLYTAGRQPMFGAAMPSVIGESESLSNGRHPLFNLTTLIKPALDAECGCDARFVAGGTMTSDWAGPTDVEKLAALSTVRPGEAESPHDRIRSWLDEKGADFILLRGPHASNLAWYFRLYPREYRLRFVNDAEIIYDRPSIPETDVDALGAALGL